MSSVVLPLPVPPATSMFLRASTQRSRKRTMRSVTLPNRIRSCAPYGLRENLRMVMQAPRSATGEMTALTREPSGRRASSIGADSSMRRPSGVTMRSRMARADSSSVKRQVVSSMRPPRST